MTFIGHVDFGTRKRFLGSEKYSQSPAVAASLSRTSSDQEAAWADVLAQCRAFTLGVLTSTRILG